MLVLLAGDGDVALGHDGQVVCAADAGGGDFDVSPGIDQHGFPAEGAAAQLLAAGRAGGWAYTCAAYISRMAATRMKLVCKRFAAFMADERATS